MAVMTFVMTAILVACSVDDSPDMMNDPNFPINFADSYGYKMKWIADKKTVGNTQAVIIGRDYNLEMSGWTLPVEYILTGILQGDDFNEAVAYAYAYPDVHNVMLRRVGITETSSSFYRISPLTNDNSLAFNISYRNSIKKCNLYIDTNSSALSFDERQNNLLGVLKVDSIEICGEGISIRNRKGLSLTFSGERE